MADIANDIASDIASDIAGDVANRSVYDVLAPYNPTEVFDPDVRSSVELDGSGNIKNLTGNVQGYVLTQGTAGTRLGYGTFNGRRVATGDGSRYLQSFSAPLLFTAASGTNPHSVLWFVSQTDLSSTRTTVSVGATSDSGSRTSWGVHFPTSAVCYRVTGTAHSVTPAGYSGTPVTRVWAYRYDGTTFEARTNLDTWVSNSSSGSVGTAQDVIVYGGQSLGSSVNNPLYGPLGVWAWWDTALSRATLDEAVAAVAGAYKL